MMMVVMMMVVVMRIPSPVPSAIAWVHISVERIVPSSVAVSIVPRVVPSSIVPRVIPSSIVPRIVDAAVIPRVIPSSIVPRIVDAAVIPRVIPSAVVDAVPHSQIHVGVPSVSVHIPSSCEIIWVKFGDHDAGADVFVVSDCRSHVVRDYHCVFMISEQVDLRGFGLFCKCLKVRLGCSFLTSVSE
jgi:hypothetical protein